MHPDRQADKNEKGQSRSSEVKIKICKRTEEQKNRGPTNMGNEFERNIEKQEEKKRRRWVVHKQDKTRHDTTNINQTDRQACMQPGGTSNFKKGKGKDDTTKTQDEEKNNTKNQSIYANGDGTRHGKNRIEERMADRRKKKEKIKSQWMDRRIIQSIDWDGDGMICYAYNQRKRNEREKRREKQREKQKEKQREKQRERK
ncbi:uncharacterized protein STEHIDRAFT_115577 [Stereum hirsutum FP-91666 SS1]|uniref:uncharacterized protein n=1 Tax=Stereum hirsutum (strain FP-91666) TaxID=721885 RepID=UPI000444A4D5|nr:uncharacterized protein STEHIDRAFT_115577 [Stereum hirsutum FP-91666 SS1]EIM80714.1 hypothetical protein STEHIDRAFT_115577 [Stereum hirsutum FP-91666 SS1]